MLVNGASGRDERRFPDPDRLDVRREIEFHLGFGYGRHVCLGAFLARMESRVALEEFFRRWREYGVPEDGIERMHSSNVRGFSGLVLENPPGRDSGSGSSQSSLRAWLQSRASQARISSSESGRLAIFTIRSFTTGYTLGGSRRRSCGATCGRAPSGGPRAARGRQARDHPIVEPERVDDRDVRKHPADHADGALGEDGALIPADPRAVLAGGEHGDAAQMEDPVLLVAPADVVLDQPALPFIPLADHPVERRREGARQRLLQLEALAPGPEIASSWPSAARESGATRAGSSRARRRPVVGPGGCAASIQIALIQSSTTRWL